MEGVYSTVNIINLFFYHNFLKVYKLTVDKYCYMRLRTIYIDFNIRYK